MITESNVPNQANAGPSMGMEDDTYLSNVLNPIGEGVLRLYHS